jgi:NAD(P)H-dependent FMN reductase
MLNVGLIIGSTRPNRFADVAAPRVVKGASARRDMRLAVLDLRDFDLPLFNEPIPPSFTGGIYKEPKAEAWRKRVGEFDAFVALTPEYNHGPSAVLKNAFDSAFIE